MDGQRARERAREGGVGGKCSEKGGFLLLFFSFFFQAQPQSSLHGGKQLDGPASPCPAVWITNEQTWHLSHHYKHLLKPVSPPSKAAEITVGNCRDWLY